VCQLGGSFVRLTGQGFGALRSEIAWR